MVGNDTQLVDLLGSDFIKGIMHFFEFDDGVEEPFFRRWLTAPYQTRPLRIKDEKIQMDL